MTNVTKLKGTNRRIIYRHGQPIEIETLEIPNQPLPRRERQKKLFAMITHEDAVAGFMALNCPIALVWYALLFRAWAEKSDTVRTPTALLRSWGVARSTWNRAVVHLEAAGLVQTVRQSGKLTTCRLVRSPARENS